MTASPEAPGPHPFARPGQTAAHLPAPDKCMTCGQAEAAHAPDPITVVRISVAGRPGAALFALCRRSLAARLVADAAEAGADQVTDLGPGALLLAQAAQRGQWGRGELLQVGIAQGGRWLRWYPPAPVEAVPGSPGAAAAQQ